MRNYFAGIVFLFAFGNLGLAQAENLNTEALGLTETEVMAVVESDQVDPNRIVRRVYECRARNARGQNFSGIARNRFQARREALRNCYQYSRSCQIVNCRVQWRIGAIEDVR